jgi:adenine-specific DNA-methyltransferase
MVIYSSEPMNYSSLSIDLTKQISKIEKKNDGIYFTPPTTIMRNIDALKKYMKNVKNVLEPSCGSCEYITALNNTHDNLIITGIEYNNTIFESIKSLADDNISLHNEDYLTYPIENKYDLILGNPPYYVMKKKDVEPCYYDYFDGRPNIFILFIIKSLKLLSDNGILSFILPKNFLNCLYYDKTRNYINSNFQILDIIECNDNYLDTKQETIIIIIQKSIGKQIKNENYCLNNDKYTIFGIPKSIIKLRSILSGSTTLQKLGFSVHVGNVVWNQCKNELTDDETKTRLIYSSDIKNKKLDIKKYSNKDKKNYISKEGEKGPILLLNRGYGVGTYNFEYCLVDEELEYLIENHLICIKYTKPINDDELKALYTRIIKSFDNKKTQDFINLYFGNNAVNTTELCELFPIY